MSSDLLIHSVCNAWEHGCATRQNNIAVQVLPDIHITLHDRVEGCVINALSFHAHQAGGEKHLRAPESLTANGNDLQPAVVTEKSTEILPELLRTTRQLCLEVQGTH